MDSALKQRLLGAAVLIALAIIFVPMFLGNSPPKDTSTIQNLDIPPMPDRKFETRTLPVEPNAGAAPAATPSAASDKVVTIDTRAPSAAAPEPPGARTAPTPPPASSTVARAEGHASGDAKPPETQPADAKAPESAPSAPAASGRFSINLGTYADAGHANALVAKLKKAGYAAASEATEYQGKPAQRVRVGPYPDRASAEAARLRIKQLEPKVPSSVAESAEQPTADAPASALPPGRAGGWAVQLGAFKSEAEANKLRDRVKGISVAAFVDRSGNGEQTLWRVRAGPYAQRAGAEAARTTLKQRLQTDGMIVTQP